MPGVDVRVSWDPNTHCSFCGAAPQSWLGIVQGPGVNICSDCIELCRAVQKDSAPATLPAGIEPIGEDVRIIVTSAAGPLLDQTLIESALAARADFGMLPAFLYRDPIDPDNPDEPRPLRRARLVLVDYGELTEAGEGRP